MIPPYIKCIAGFLYGIIIRYMFLKEVAREATFENVRVTIQNRLRSGNDARKTMLFKLDIQLDHIIDLVLDKI